MTHRKPRRVNKNIKAVQLWSKENIRNNVFYDSNASKTGYSKIEYLVEGYRVYVHVISGMNPLFEDVLGVLLKDTNIQRHLREFYAADHEEKDRESFYRIREESGMSGCTYVYEDWAIRNTSNSGIPRVNSKLLFSISSLGKIDAMDISVASLYRFLLYKKKNLEERYSDYECKFSRKNAARTLRKNGTRVRYCWSPAKQYFAEANEYTHVNEYTYKSLW